MIQSSDFQLQDEQICPSKRQKVDQGHTDQDSDQNVKDMCNDSNS